LAPIEAAAFHGRHVAPQPQAISVAPCRIVFSLAQPGQRARKKPAGRAGCGAWDAGGGSGGAGRAGVDAGRGRGRSNRPGCDTGRRHQSMFRQAQSVTITITSETRNA
jgi:hypothetical protein